MPRTHGTYMYENGLFVRGLFTGELRKIDSNSRNQRLRVSLQMSTLKPVCAENEQQPNGMAV